MRILVIGADREKVSLLAKGLRQYQYPVDLAFETSTGKYLFEKVTYHLIIVFHADPGVDGLEICRSVRAANGSALLLMLALPGECNVFEGYSVGVDCYLHLPAECREIIARVHAIARRTDRQPRPGSLLRAGEIVVDLDRKEVNLRGKPVSVTASEFRILQFMIQHKNRIVTREELAGAIWGTHKSDGARRLPVHMNNLRGKLAEGAYDTSGIYTVSRRGYLMVDNNDQIKSIK